ncbi:MAG: zinc ribbon domain-containing protein [Pirellulales bacterium]
MPLYEYNCENCGQPFEVLVRCGEQPECPACGGKKLQKLLSVPAAHTGGTKEMLPVCNPPAAGGCGAPWCGQGSCDS